MATVIQLFAGILIGGGVFAATLFSAAQAFRQSGPLRRAHLAAALLTLAAMACLSAELWRLSQLAGGALIAAALAAALLDRRWNRLLPAFQLAFGAALLAGLPFGG